MLKVIKRVVQKIVIEYLDESFVSCSVCNCLILRCVAKKIQEETDPGLSSFWFRHPETFYYCKKHEPKYDRIMIFLGGGKKFFLDKVEVNSNGKIIERGGKK